MANGSEVKQRDKKNIGEIVSNFSYLIYMRYIRSMRNKLEIFASYSMPLIAENIDEQFEVYL